ncbi:omptin family outer membrane protease [Sinorhizobium medicae]|nr:omptin family outer membrane protease [Sinorhizobium medicae]
MTISRRRQRRTWVLASNISAAIGKSDSTRRGAEGKKLRLKTEALNERRLKRVSIRSVAISCFLFAAPSFAAADKALFSFDNGNFVVFGDIGLAKIKAQEFFYVGDHEISQLNWEGKGVTLFTVGVDGQIDNNWSLKGSVKVNTGGNGHLVDYDCKIPEHEDWSHRSIHPLTGLDHYVAVAIELDRIINGGGLDWRQPRHLPLSSFWNSRCSSSTFSLNTSTTDGYHAGM